MKEKDDKTIFTGREVAVLIEDLRAEFRSVGEGLKALREKVESVRENQVETLEKITAIELRLTRIESDFTKRLSAFRPCRNYITPRSEYNHAVGYPDILPNW